MNKIKLAFIALLLLAFCQNTFAQQQQLDSLRKVARKTTIFSGSVGMTNNGFSIVPTFSLNSPSSLMLFSIRKNKFSFDPDFRFTTNYKKGGMLFWFRYHLIEKKRFSLRIGTHPAFNFALRNITENGVTTTITQVRRFIANEVAPNYKIKPNWSIGLYYLNGNGLQKDGPKLLHFLTLNTNISNIKVGGDFRFQFIPAVYYLNIDGIDGKYFTATGILTKKKVPFSLSSSINKTIKTNIGGGKDFLWNVSLSYHFNKKMVSVE
ncbi:MAG: hypothetical protein RLZZ292_3377 [Bacteroidota bacterium]|jgi:hypothetical protein